MNSETNIRLHTNYISKYFKIEWVVENLSACEMGSGISIESPRFSIGGDNSKDMSVSLYVYSIKPVQTCEPMNITFPSNRTFGVAQPVGANLSPVSAALSTSIFTSTPTNVEYVAIQLCPYFETEKSIKFKMYFLNSKKEKVFERSLSSRFCKSRGNFGFPQFCSRSDLFSKEKDIIVNDKLVLVVELQVTHGSSHSSREISTEKDDSLSQDFAKLLTDSDLSDVTMKVGDKELKLHKLVLSARSPVFAAMFKHDMAESQSNTVKVEDVEADVMEEVIQYMYSGVTPKMEDRVEAFLAIADRYQLEGLKAACAKVLFSCLEVDNAANILALADSHNVPSLKEDVVFFITSYAQEVLETESWKQLGTSHPHLVNEVNASLVRKLIMLTKNITIEQNSSEPAAQTAASPSNPWGCTHHPRPSWRE